MKISLVGATAGKMRSAARCRNHALEDSPHRANLDLRQSPSQVSATHFAPRNNGARGLSFSPIGPYIRCVGSTDYGDKQAMQ